jgi:hypothetical protein
LREAAPEREPAVAKAVSDAEVDFTASAVRGDLERGDYQAVLEATDDLYARGADADQRARLEPLRLEARRRLLQTAFLDGVIRLDRDDFSIGEPVTGEVLLVNLSPQEIAIDDLPRDGSRRGDGARSSLHFEVRYAEHAADGSLVRDRLTWTVALGRDLKIAPGARAAFPLDLDTAAQGAGGTALRIYEIEATLYPAELRAGDERLTGTVKFKPRIVRVFPRNYEHLKRDPVGRLGEAIRKRSPVHLPLAAGLVAPADRDRALDVLRSALFATGDAAPDAPTAVAICVAARILTGEELAPEPRRWADRLGPPGKPR